MKNTVVILLLLASAAGIQAQSNPKYLAAMEKALAGMDTLSTGDQWLAKSNMFERIAQKETGEWLPPYYVALCQAMIFNMDQDPSKYEALCEKAERNIAVADSLNPDNSEIYVLKSMAAGMRIRINPMVNGQKYGPEAAMTLEKAMALDPENPRVYMNKGMSLFFTPAQWGGDPVKGKELMELADEKFAAFKPASSIHPSWGKSANDYILEMARKQ
ncbi:MAG: hypothetical protein R3D58_12735 [Saprospiraceae bacterium]